MDRIECFQAFVAVVDAGSFTGAADRLGLSRALVSKRIAALEDHLGARLLNRTTRRLSVTGAGASFYPRCARLLEEFEKARDEVRQQQVEPSGVLRINAPMSFGVRHLAPAVAAFMAAHPRVDIILTLNDRFVDLIEEGYDLGIRIGALADSSLTARRLTTARRAVVAAPRYLEAAPPIATPTDLARHRCLHYGYLASGTRWKLTGPDGEQTVPITPVLCANNGDVLLAAARDGLGVALLPTFICGPALASGDLVAVLNEHGPPEIAIHAIWPTSRLLPVKVRGFIDFLVERFADPPEWDRGVPLPSR